MFKHPFKDVPASFSYYVGYITNGKFMKAQDAARFGTDKPMSADEFTKLILQSLGYIGREIPPGQALDYAWDVGMITEAERKQLQNGILYRNGNSYTGVC